MTIQQAQQSLRVQLQSIYDDREAANIANWVMESLTGLERVHRIVQQYNALTPGQEATLQQYTADLLAHRPVQYVLHEAWFYGMKLFVDENVLIPRPETEELVEWIVEEVRSRKAEGGGRRTEEGGLKEEEEITIFDVGTGSGCIPLALKKALPSAVVHACDVSPGALLVAQRNAASVGVSIEWHLLDFLQRYDWNLLPSVDILVSNPPYIPLKDKASMHANVLEHEPHLALFVENDDPLLFYRHLALFAQQKLRPGGRIYAEIHEDLGPATAALFESHGFTGVTLKKDLQGKDRMIRAMNIS